MQSRARPPPDGAAPVVATPSRRAASAQREAVGVHHKLETYSLVLEHGRGGDKPMSSTALGITHREVDHLAAEIRAAC